MFVFSIASILLRVLPFGYDSVPHSVTLRSHGGTQLDSHCSAVPPILKLEFDARQVALASVLHKLNASAYITEPSANSQYYANFSSSNWKLSERPLLLIARPQPDAHGKVEPEITLLTPKVSYMFWSRMAVGEHPKASLKRSELVACQSPRSRTPLRATYNGLKKPILIPPPSPV